MKSKKCFNERMFLVCIFSLGLFAIVSGTSEVFDITSFGAKGDGKTLNTKAIRLAIDAANKNGGGRVVVPAGRFLTGTVMLKSGVDLHLIQGATLLGSTNYYDYKRNHSFMGIIIATNQNNIAVSGEGVINGQGDKVVLSVIHLMKKGILSDQYRLNRPSECFRPSLVELYRCKNVKITGVTMENAACWVPVHCTDHKLKPSKLHSPLLPR